MVLVVVPMRTYREILDHADRHFRGVEQQMPEQLECRRGCTMCCHGLFEIGAADVATIADGLRQLDSETRRGIVARAESIVEKSRHPHLRESTAQEKEAFFARTEMTPCPALEDDGGCAIYLHRPLVCRTFGLPLRDGSNYIGDICELNFTQASQEEKDRAAWDLQWEDILGVDDQYTVPEALILADRLVRK